MRNPWKKAKLKNPMNVRNSEPNVLRAIVPSGKNAGRKNNVALHSAISVCTGVGGLDHGLDIALGGTLVPILYVEREAFAAANLAWQMEKGLLAPAPIWSDLAGLTSPGPRRYIRSALGGRPLEIFFGGIPCQPYSNAGNRAGAKDDRDLWPASLKAIDRYKPGLVFIENVAGFLSSPDGANRVIADLEELGFAATAGLFSSEETGASHKRERCFILANRPCDKRGKGYPHDKTLWEKFEAGGASCQLAHGEHRGSQTRGRGRNRKDACRETIENGSAPEKCGQSLAYAGSQPERKPYNETSTIGRIRNQGETVGGGYNSMDNLPRYAPPRNDYGAWADVARLDPSRMPAIESKLCGVVDGMASRSDRLQAIGNGVDCLVAAYAFVTLWACIQRLNGNL